MTEANETVADGKTVEETHEENNTFVASETGEAPTALSYLGHGEYTGTDPIVQGAPHYYNGRLVTTQEELDEIRAKIEEDRVAAIKAQKDAQDEAEGKNDKKKK